MIRNRRAIGTSQSPGPGRHRLQADRHVSRLVATLIVKRHQAARDQIAVRADGVLGGQLLEKCLQTGDLIDEAVLDVDVHRVGQGIGPDAEGLGRRGLVFYALLVGTVAPQAAAGPIAVILAQSLERRKSLAGAGHHHLREPV